MGRICGNRKELGQFGRVSMELGATADALFLILRHEEIRKVRIRAVGLE
jgi:hypothetical protein